MEPKHYTIKMLTNLNFWLSNVKKFSKIIIT